MKTKVLGLLLAVFSVESVLGEMDSESLKKWPSEVRQVQIVNPTDQGREPALFCAPLANSGPRPLIVFLHQWGGDYLYAGGVPVARWCVAQNWAFVQPNFRGPNRRPEALGSDLVLSDIRAAVEYAKEHADIDASRIYLLGASGGGHAALLAAGRMPGVFRAVSAWVPIIDLVAWHSQTDQTKYANYARDIENACGGVLTPGSNAEQEAMKRSPLAHLAQAKGTLFDLNAGIHDGHSHAVPISHTFHAFNLLAQAEDQVSDENIKVMTEQEMIPEELRFSGVDSTYAKKPVLFRATSSQARVTIFEGGHELVASAALAWLKGVADANQDR